MEAASSEAGTTVIKTREDSGVGTEVVAGDGRSSGGRSSGKTDAGGREDKGADSTTPTTRDMAAARDTMTAIEYHITSNSVEVVEVALVILSY